MATIPTLSYLQSDENIIQQLITRPLPVDADLFDVADNCAALVTVLVESDDSVISSALCERLLQALHRLRELCDADLPPNLIEQLIMGEKMTSCVPDCWHDTATQIDYALALTQAVKGGTLPANVAKELTGLLHDMIWLLAEFVKEPRIVSH
ncbi:hypothetical protein H9Q89_17590 [Enterobacter cloacae]|uniref:hypothetical protein n=1 Tax=Enterobacter TaxID=547 RepID=UPI0006DB718D|nr:MULTISPECIES: hypothetical protein [Enterobacter]EKX4032198.1 hypothetical protein [Enterobacter cloacae]ELD6621624.1 hypothetical protein [Enterobacter cloacae]KAA3577803.1 hypothetical protein D1177_07330 [Enterobacter cloacae]KAA3578340.1 hypothetical protein D1176_07335 [Enterobacter cloacae]KAA3592151.1 hypothetical protein D1175_05965 [Enterobacter cloacae]